MSYYSVLGLSKEPFSTSPDPDFFYHSQSHYTALKRLEISIRLRRGLNIILGDVGMGKTTLMRTLIREFKQEQDYIFHMSLDPCYNSEYNFLSSLVKMFGITSQLKSTTDFKEALEKYLYSMGVEKNKTIILLIDEAQKISVKNLEVLRTLLNFETNEYKLLQLVIMGQTELLPRIKRIKNFMDRISLKYTINPLDEAETKQLIEFRLKAAGYSGKKVLFSDEAIQKVYQYSQGYPRKISMLCHDILENVVMRDAEVVDPGLVEILIEREKKYG